MVDIIRSRNAKHQSGVLRERNNAIWRNIAHLNRWRASDDRGRQSVEDYLAAGGNVTQCPTVVLVAPDWIHPTFRRRG